MPLELYAPILIAHSLNRWLVLGLAVAVLVSSTWALARRKPWELAHGRLGTWSTIAFDVQLLMGLALLMTRLPRPAFFATVHPAAMILAVVVLHAGRFVASHRPTATGRHATILVATALALGIALAAVPWPGSENPRPLYRSLSSAFVEGKGPAA